MIERSAKLRTDLEVPSNDKKVDAIPAVDLTGFLDRGVYGVQGAMTLRSTLTMDPRMVTVKTHATFNSNTHIEPTDTSCGYDG